MRIDQPISYRPERLWTARTLARLLREREAERWSEDDMTQRVAALRREVAAGVYRVDAEALAASVTAAIVSGGI
jgi:hypothetical protein